MPPRRFRSRLVNVVPPRPRPSGELLAATVKPVIAALIEQVGPSFISGYPQFIGSDAAILAQFPALTASHLYKLSIWKHYHEDYMYCIDYIYLRLGRSTLEFLFEVGTRQHVHAFTRNRLAIVVLVGLTAAMGYTEAYPHLASACDPDNLSIVSQLLELGPLDPRALLDHRTVSTKMPTGEHFAFEDAPVFRY